MNIKKIDDFIENNWWVKTLILLFASCGLGAILWNMFYIWNIFQ